MAYALCSEPMKCSYCYIVWLMPPYSPMKWCQRYVAWLLLILLPIGLDHHTNRFAAEPGNVDDILFLVAPVEVPHVWVNGNVVRLVTLGVLWGVYQHLGALHGGHTTHSFKSRHGIPTNVLPHKVYYFAHKISIHKWTGYRPSFMYLPHFQFITGTSRQSFAMHYNLEGVRNIEDALTPVPFAHAFFMPLRPSIQ